MRALFFSTILLLITFNVFAQKLEYFSNHDGFNQLLFANNKAWIATDGGLLELSLDGKLLKKHTVLDGITSAKISAVAKNENGDIFIETRSSIQVYQNGRWEEYTDFPKNKYISLVNSNGLFGILQKSEDELYLSIDQKWSKYKTPPESDGWKLNTKMIFDAAGNLWVGYEQGAVRYNEKGLKVYQFLPQYREANAFFVDKNKVLWAHDNSTEKMHQYDPEKDEWVACETADCIKIAETRIILKDASNNCWFTNSDGDLLYKYDGKGLDSVAVPVMDVDKGLSSGDGKDWIYTGAVAPNGELWLGSLHGNLYRYNGKTWVTSNLSDTTSFVQNRRMNLAFIQEDKNRNIWLGESDYMTYIDIDTDERTRYTREDFTGAFRFAVAAVDALIENEKGELYTTVQEGVFKLNAQRDKWVYMGDLREVELMHYDKKKKIFYQLSEDGMLIKEESDGAITYEQMVKDEDADGYIFYRASHCDAQGGFWVSAEDQLYYSYNDSLQIFNKSNSPIDREPYFIYEDSKGRIWVAAKNTLAYWDHKKWTLASESNKLVKGIRDSRGSCFPIAEDNNGNIVIRTRSTLFKWDGRKWKSHRKWNSCLADAYSGGLFVDSKNNNWILNDNEKVFKCKDADCTAIIPKLDATYSTILEDKKGRIWILTKYSGLFLYTP